MAEFDETLATALKALTPGGEKAWNFAMFAKGSEVVKLLVDKRPIPASAVTGAKKDAKATVAFGGTVVRGDGKDLVFRVEEEPPIDPARVKRFLVDAAWLRLEPRFEVATADAPEAPAFDAVLERLLAARKRVQSRLEAIVAVAPDRKPELKVLTSRFKEQLEAGDHEGAEATLRALRERVAELEEQLPRPSTTGSEERESLEDWKRRVDDASYGVGKRIGKGGFGEVRLLHDLDDPTAPKVVAKFAFSGKESFLEEEARVYAELGDHPNLPRCFGLKEIDGKRALVLESVQGGTLGGDGNPNRWYEALTASLETGALSLDEYWGVLQHVLRGLLGGLAHLESKGFVHADVKLPNVMVDFTTGDVKLIDIGGAVKVGDYAPTMSQGWVAPEGRSSVTGTFDVWAAGRMARLGGKASTGSFGPGGEDGASPRGLAFDQFLARLTDPDPKTRLSAADALKHPFLADALLDEDGARAVLKRKPMEEPIPYLVRPFTWTPRYDAEGWVANMEGALAAGHIRGKQHDPRTGGEDTTALAFLREGAERLRAFEAALARFRGIARLKDLEGKVSAGEEAQSLEDDFESWLQGAKGALDREEDIDRQDGFLGYTGDLLSALGRRHGDVTAELDLGVPEVPSGPLAEAWTDLRESLAEAFERELDFFRQWVDSRVEDLARKSGTKLVDRGEATERILAERGFVEGDVVATFGFDPAFGDLLIAFDAAEGSAKEELRRRVHPIAVRHVDAFAAAESRLFRPVEGTPDTYDASDLFRPHRVRLAALAYAIDPDGEVRD